MSAHYKNMVQKNRTVRIKTVVNFVKPKPKTAVFGKTEPR